MYPGGLAWEQTSKGILFFWWAIVQNVVPIFTGGFADVISKRKLFFISFTIIVMSYIGLGFTQNYYGVLLCLITLGIGSGILKPTFYGYIAKTIEGKNTALGWGYLFHGS